MCMYCTNMYFHNIDLISITPFWISRKFAKVNKDLFGILNRFQHTLSFNVVAYIIILKQLFPVSKWAWEKNY